MNPFIFQRDRVSKVRVHVLPTDRFKTVSVAVYIGRPLREDKVTPTALIPFILRRGTERLPETKQFREQLDDLYGTGFGFDISKKGNYQMVQFMMDTIHGEFVSDPSDLLEGAIRLMGEVLTQPALAEGGFLPKYVDAEKLTLRKRLEAIVNDKRRYAAERCIQEMCRKEPYRLNQLGDIGDLDGLDPGMLYAEYRSWLADCPIDLYVVGNTSLDEVKRHVREHFHVPSQPSAVYDTTLEHLEADEVRTVVERLEVSQGKLNLGLRAPVAYRDALYPAALMYNGILGAYPHSKLFVNVREKASLAYYANSRYDGHKGIMTVQSGIEVDRYEQALDIIKRQLASMADGEISDLELSQTRAMITNQLKEIQDSAFEMIAFDFNSILSGTERSVPALIQAIGEAEPAAIRQVAHKVQLDTVYFLRDRKGE